MAVQVLHQLFTGLIMSKITYALRAFAGQLTVDDRNRTNAISRKALRRGVTHTAFEIEEIIDNRKLFSKITHSGHCLHHLLPPSSSSRMRVINHNWSATKQRPHPQSVAEIRRLNTALTVLGKENTITLQLPNVELLLYKNCFINRCLFKFRWYSVCFVLFLMFYVFL